MFIESFQKMTEIYKERERNKETKRREEKKRVREKERGRGRDGWTSKWHLSHFIASFVSLN